MALIPETNFRSCGCGCEFAEEIQGTFGEWYWCRHPAAQVRLIRALRECRLPQRAVRPPSSPAPTASEQLRRAA